MNIQCKICGKTVENLDTCPLCGSKLSDQNEIDDNYITEGLNEKFQDKKIDIKFNLRQIVNELDYKKDFSLKRKFYINMALINHIRKFRKYYEK